VRGPAKAIYPIDGPNRPKNATRTAGFSCTQHLDEPSVAREPAPGRSVREISPRGPGGRCSTVLAQGRGWSSFGGDSRCVPHGSAEHHEHEGGGPRS
jgi:hypothetical protein